MPPLGTRDCQRHLFGTLKFRALWEWPRVLETVATEYLKLELGDIQDDASCSWTESPVKDEGAGLGFCLLPHGQCLMSLPSSLSPASGGEGQSMLPA